MKPVEMGKVSPKKLEANRRNAQHSTGPRSQRGKEWSRRNAQKHGILSSALLIRKGLKEDAAEFEAMLSCLSQDLAPLGCLEKMMVEKIAVSWWRLQRALRFEAQAICKASQEEAANVVAQPSEKEMMQLLANMQDMESQAHRNRCGVAERFRVQRREELFGKWRKCRIEEADDLFDENMRDRVSDLLGEAALAPLDDALSKEKASDADSPKSRPFSLPADNDLNRILRYDAASNRQLYQAINQLERLQRARKGEHVPAPVNVQVSSDG